MEYRQLGHSGLKVSELSLGTGTFGGGTEFFKAWGETNVNEARRLIDISLEAGINLFDTADIYSNGLSEEILGKAVEGKRQDLLISTKTTFRLGKGPNDVGSSRYHIVRAAEASLRRLNTDYIDVYREGYAALFLFLGAGLARPSWVCIFRICHPDRSGRHFLPHRSLVSRPRSGGTAAEI
jgi:aryl-alcohol dehydrogenase-like predicted oxidoreductase